MEIQDLSLLKSRLSRLGRGGGERAGGGGGGGKIRGHSIGLVSALVGLELSKQFELFSRDSISHSVRRTCNLGLLALFFHMVLVRLDDLTTIRWGGSGQWK